MGFDKDTRNRLSHFVANARTLLKEEIEDQLQAIYGIRLDGTIESTDTLTALDEPGLQLAHTLRERISYLARTHATEKTPEACTQKAIEQLAREQAFTVLNRLAAIRMAEKRNIVQESVAKGYQSRGFKVFESLAGSSLGEIYARYLQYIHCLFDELTLDLGMLFNRSSPQGILFPREPALMPLLELFNSPDLENLWAEDETVGWIYQYYNDPAERKEMRDKSSAPRNSRELAVRNQFFTPRYVVEFLTDNTLGRIWYEMCQGQTNLKDRCRYLVRRPNEIFLKEGEAAPEQPKQENLSQEELLKQAVYIPYRQLKDPRTILMLDPACGSMHFGLYAFDLFEEIYHEAWDREEQNKGALLRPKGMKPLHQFYADKTLFLADIPRLIIEHNIHGVDIDPRATQIAALSLWLRAHRTWNDQKTPLAQRSRITKSHIVCAEPMPGDPALLKEFVKTSFPGPQQPLFQHLLEQIFEKMQLAGEAGSLLKIEEEITSSVEEAKAAWAKSSSASKELFGTAELNAAKKPGSQAELPGMDNALSALDVTTDFWERIEERIYAALRDYAEQAETGGGFQRRLFAEDAARGFAFIDICRKRYDVALMNPPFGEPAKQSRILLGANYPSTKHDLFAAFTERTLSMLAIGGFLGEISSRVGFFIKSFDDWRNKVMGIHSVVAIADLGFGVLDDATVEAASYIVEKRPSEKQGLTRVFRLLVESDKANTLLNLMSGSSDKRIFMFSVAECECLPLHPWIYWVSREVREKLAHHEGLEPAGAVIRQGLGTGDNNRFIRALWEVPPELIATTTVSSTGFAEQFSLGKRWAVHVRSGSSQPWYSPLTVLIDWENQGLRLKEHWRSRGESPSRYIPSEDLYFRPGFSWTLRAFRLIPYLIPRGCIPSASRYMGFPRSGYEFSVLGTTASNLASCFSRFYGEMFARPKHLVDTIKRLPFAQLPVNITKDLEKKITAEVESRRMFFRNFEPFSDFVTPANIQQWATDESSNWSPVSLLGEELELDIATSFGLSNEELALLEFDLKEAIEVRRRTGSGVEDDDSDATEDDSSCDTSTAGKSIDIILYLIGVAFGRWDIRYATGEQAAPELPDPFAPLPVCPPGQLQNAQGLPARPEDVPASYPLKNIPWDGILVDDPNHPLDIEHRIREVIEIIWNGKEGGPNAEAIEHEACEILGVKSLRDYFRKPAGFFADHLKRYSKSRRQAPIYWPLSTKSGSYTLWIYYHRLTDQTLHTCLIDFVIPKLKSIGNEIGNLRENKITGERLEALLELQEELSDFKAELEEIIKLTWKPNLNDGVLINAAPLWKLFRLPAWQKKLKATWDELTKGDYDWAHLAYTIWPERVKDACKTDRSMAIAHGLEHLCTIEAPKAKAKRKVKASSEDGAELDLFSNAPEIEEAEDSITIPPKGRKSTAKKPVEGEKVTRPRGRPAKAPKSDNPQGDK